MARDWSSVGFAAHPIPGRPDDLRVYSNYYRDVAEQINETAANLRGETLDADHESEALTEFKDLSLDVASMVNMIDERYGAVADILDFYAEGLEQIQDRAEAKRHSADLAESHLRNVEYSRVELQQQLEGGTLSEANIAIVQQQLDAKEYEAATTRSQIAAAISAIESLQRERHSLADEAGNRIEDVIRGRDLNDTAWDHVCDWAASIGGFLLDCLEAIVAAIELLAPYIDILTMLMTIVGFLLVLTGVGVAVGLALIQIAQAIDKVMKIVKIAKIGMLAVLAAGGRRPWSDALNAGVEFGADKLAGKLIDPASDAVVGKIAEKTGLNDALAGRISDAVNAGDLDLVPGGGTPGLGQIELGDYFAMQAPSLETPEFITDLANTGLNATLDVYQGPVEELTGIDIDIAGQAKDAASDLIVDVAMMERPLPSIPVGGAGSW